MPASNQSDGHSLIDLRNLRREFRQGTEVVHALKPTTLQIHEGEFVAIVGPSGSGKSTLMYVLGCLDSPTAGDFFLAGQEVGRLADADLSRVRGAEIGYVFQQFFLLSELTVVENIALGLTYAGVDRATRQARATELAEQLGLGHRLNHRPVELSGGQMQRVAIARALAARPHMLLADEPTGALDSKTGEEIMQVFRDLHQRGRTIVLITHDRKVAEQADRIITLVDGEIQSDDVLRERPSQPAATTFGLPIAGGPPEGPSDDVQADSVRLDQAGKPRNQAGMAWRDLLRTALREGVLAHKLRSLLTMMGIVFGIAAVITMTAITEGGKQQQLEILSQIGLTTIHVQADDLQGSALLAARRINPLGLSRDDAAVLEQHVPGVVAVSSAKEILAEVRVDRRTVTGITVWGVAGSWGQVTNLRLADGRFFDGFDQETRARIAIVGITLAEEIAATRGLPSVEAVVDQPLLVGDAVLTVVGILPRQPGGDSGVRDLSVPDRNRHCYVPLDTALAMYPLPDRGSELDRVVLLMDDPGSLVERSYLVQELLTGLHDGAEDTTVSVPLQTLEQARSTEDMFNGIIVLIAGISLLVGGIGIMNIMLASVTERTREIGIRRAIGATRTDVLRQFLTEACVLSLGGGLLGIGVGALGAQVLALIFTIPVSIHPGVVAVASGVSVVIGICFGLYPAWQAAQRDPVEALRV